MNVSKTFVQNLISAALVLALCLLTLTSVFALTNADHNLADNKAVNSFDPSASFKSSWIDYNVTEGSRKGMRIHVNLEVTGLKGVDSKLVARVQNEDDDYLPSSSSYSNNEGQLETSYAIKPGYPTTAYEDADLFLPYSEIGLRKGVWNLKLDIDLNYENGDLIQHLTFKDFEFTAPNYAGDASTTTKNSDITAKVSRVWVDYDVFENRRKGMRIHVNFEVTGLKDVDSKLTVRVRREDDSFLISRTSLANEEGQLEVSFSMKPGYPTSVYKDADIFLPYDEISLRKGDWNLKLDIDLNYENGDLIEHLAYHEFEFTK
ncbi:MAG TPA: hypothetical protein VGC97_14120 [Pyrinomonadaceae bacterium]